MPTPSAKYTEIKTRMHAGTGFRAHYHGPSTPGNPEYHVLPCLMGWNAAGQEKVLGFKYNGGNNGEGWRCFLVADFGDINDSNAHPPTVGAVNESTQVCIDNIDHT